MPNVHFIQPNVIVNPSVMNVTTRYAWNNSKFICNQILKFLKSFQFIDLVNNPLRCIFTKPYSRWSLNLVSLNLNHNFLSDFDFRSLNLSILIDLSYNNLADFTTIDFINDMELTFLTFGSNNVTKLIANFMKHFKRLETLDARLNLIE